MPVCNRQKHSRNLKLTKCIAGKMENNRLRLIVFTCQAAERRGETDSRLFGQPGKAEPWRQRKDAGGAEMKLGEKIVKLRKERGLSQEALAEQIGTTRQAVSKWENDQGFPETEKLLQLSNVFEVSVDFLLKDERRKPGSTRRATMSAENLPEDILRMRRRRFLVWDCAFSSGHWPVCPG